MLDQAASLLNNVNVGHAADIAQQQFGGGNAANGADKNMLQDVMSSVLGSSNSSTSADQNDLNFAKTAFDKIYGQNQKSSSPQDLGAASALKAFQMFTSGGNSSGGGSSEKLTGLAMGEGMKLFTNNNAGAAQNDILKSAVLWVMKLFVTRQQGNSNPAFGTLMGLVGGGNNTANMGNDAGNTGTASSLGSKILGKFM